MQTSQLHKIPLVKACTKVSDVLADAIPIAAPGLLTTPPCTARNTIRRDLPHYEKSTSERKTAYEERPERSSASYWSHISERQSLATTAWYVSIPKTHAACYRKDTSLKASTLSHRIKGSVSASRNRKCLIPALSLTRRSYPSKMTPSFSADHQRKPCPQ